MNDLQAALAPPIFPARRQPQGRCRDRQVHRRSGLADPAGDDARYRPLLFGRVGGGDRGQAQEAGGEWADKQLAALMKLSPLAMAITLEQLKRCANRSFEDSMTIEYRMSQRAMRPDHDFFEGVRALLIDKDQKPKWNPPTIDGVTPAMVEAHFKPVSNDLFFDCRAEGSDMAKIAFIGLGNMGGPMAANLAKAQHHVRPSTCPMRQSRGGREGRAQGRQRRRGSEGRRDRRHHAAGRQPCARGLREGRAAQRRQGRAADRLLDHRRRERTPRRRRPKRRASRWSTRRCRAASAAPRPARSPSWSAAGAAFAKARPILEKMGKNIVHAGDSGDGQAAKICNNMILGISMIAVRKASCWASGSGSMRRSCSTSCRRRPAVLVGEQLSVRCRARSDLARQSRLPGRLHGRHDAEGPEARAAGPAGSGASTPLGAEAAQLFSLFVNSGNGGKDFSGIIRMLDGK